MNIRTDWLGLNLQSPLILASLTSVSHSRHKEQIDFWLRAEERGIGAIVVESVLPGIIENYNVKSVQNDLLALNTEVIGRNKNANMGFTLLGPPYPNISSLNYVLRLIHKAKKNLGIPLIASVTNFGSLDEIISACQKLEECGADAIELNFSCPNIPNAKRKNGENILPTALNKISLDTILAAIKLPISLKLSPQNTFDFSLVKSSKLKSITYANAYLGLTPPALTFPFGGRFGRSEHWAPTGIYGPLDRYFTYYGLYTLRKNLASNIEISVVGGSTSKEHIIESILLGGNTVQLSSGLFWNGLKLVSKANTALNTFMRENGFKSIDAFRGRSLKYIEETAYNLETYNINSEQCKPRPKIHITDKCTNCLECYDRGCLALVLEDRKIRVIEELCSGCGWCEILCPVKGAISR